MKRNIFLLTFLSVLLLACSIQPSDRPVRILGEAQGTYYSIIYYDEHQRDFQFEIDSILHDFDLSVSLWVPNSILSRVNNNDSNVSLDTYFIDNFNLSKKVSAETNGVFDFTIGSLIKAWGFGYDATPHADSAHIDSLLLLVGYEKVHLEQGKVVKENPSVTFDFNAIAQGYSVDVIAAFLESRDIENYLVDIGGEVKGKGKKPDGSYWKVGIEKPAEQKDDGRDLKAIVELKNQSIATSGNYRKFFEVDGQRYSHMINPKTGYPARHNLLSVSVVAASTALADAYATACMVMGFEKAKIFVENEAGLEAFFIYAGPQGDYLTYATKGFPELDTSMGE